MKHWQRVEPTTVQKIGWRTIVSKTFILPDGTTSTFQTYEPEDQHYAGLIALTPDNRVIVVQQYRPGPEQVFYEVPGGGVEPDEENHYKHAAIRELEEETGYSSRNVTKLGTFYKDAYSNASWHYYLALDCELTGSGQQLDDNEFATVTLLSIKDFLDKAKAGAVTDGEAVFLAHEYLLERI